MIKKLAWEIVPGNSVIQFKIKWFGINSIEGRFSKFHAIVKADQFFTNPEIHLLIEAGSALTPDATWNKYMGAVDFLSVEFFPYIEFASVGSCHQRSPKIWELSGDLSIKGITKNVTMIVNFSEIKKTRRTTTAVFHLFGTISRNDFVLNCSSNERVGDEILLSSVITLTSVQHEL